LFHMAMGAILGIAAWSRGQEKMSGAISPIATPSTKPILKLEPEDPPIRNTRND